TFGTQDVSYAQGAGVRGLALLAHPVMELQEVNIVGLEPPQAHFHGCPDGGCDPPPVVGADPDLGRVVDLVPEGLPRLSQDLLGFTLTIGRCDIDDIYAQIVGPLNGPETLFIGRQTPHLADPTASHANNGHR